MNCIPTLFILICSYYCQSVTIRTPKNYQQVKVGQFVEFSVSLTESASVDRVCYVVISVDGWFEFADCPHQFPFKVSFVVPEENGYLVTAFARSNNGTMLAASSTVRFDGK